MNDRVEQKKDFIKAVAKLCANDQAMKSIALEMGKSHAREWAEIRNTIPGMRGYPTLTEAVEALEAFLL